MKNEMYKRVAERAAKTGGKTGSPLTRSTINVFRKRFGSPAPVVRSKPSLDQMITHRVKLPKIKRPVSLVPTEGFVAGVDVNAYNMKKNWMGGLNVRQYSKGGYAPDRIAVNAEHRRKGIATALHRKAEKSNYKLSLPASSYESDGKALTKSMMKNKAVSFKSVPGFIG